MTRHYTLSNPSIEPVADAFDSNQMSTKCESLDALCEKKENAPYLPLQSTPSLVVNVKPECTSLYIQNNDPVNGYSRRNSKLATPVSCSVIEQTMSVTTSSQKIEDEKKRHAAQSMGLPVPVTNQQCQLQAASPFSDYTSDPCHSQMSDRQWEDIASRKKKAAMPITINSDAGADSISATDKQSVTDSQLAGYSDKAKRTSKRRGTCHRSRRRILF